MLLALPWGMKRFIILFLAVFSLFWHNAVASEIRLTTDVTTDALSRAEAHHSQPMWIFIADGLGTDTKIHKQVFYQYYLEGTTTADATSPKVQLTTNNFDASKAMFGPTTTITYYDNITTGTPVSGCKGGHTFFYLGDSDTDLKNELHMSCLDSATTFTETTTVAFDVQLTGWDTVTDFDVKDYDVPHLDSPTTVINYPALASAASYPVVFTTGQNKLHMLMFDPYRIASDDSNITDPTPSIVYDYIDSISDYVWNSRTINSLGKFFTPKFDYWANNIVYSISPAPRATKQLGTIDIKGRYPYRITNGLRNVLNPRFHGDKFTIATDANRFGMHVFFELEGTGSIKTQLAYLPMIYAGMPFYTGTFQFCNSPAYLTDGIENSSDLRTDYGSSGDLNAATLLLYKTERPDGNHDIMAAKAQLIDFVTPYYYCDGYQHAADGSLIKMVSASSGIYATSSYDLSATGTALDKVTDTTQLTCMNDNTAARFLPNVYHAADGDFSQDTSGQDLLDIIFLRDFTDGSGKALGQIYDAENATDECVGTCTETGDGSIGEDINGFRDGDGIFDSCESPTCKQLVDADWTGGDADSDTVINNVDNCPCDVNLDQADRDSDHWGDVCDIAFDECGTTDTDGDGTGDNCDECDDDPDYTELPFDNNLDDVADSCISINLCGETDTDGDGTFDDCDACPSDPTYQSPPFDINGDGVMDSCLASPCGTVDVDSDSVFDNCDACPNNPETSTLTFDVNADGLVDSCEAAAVTPEVVPQQNIELQTFSGGVKVGGGNPLEGLFSCSLNTQIESSQATSQTTLWLSVVLALTAALTQARQKAKQRSK